MKISKIIKRKAINPVINHVDRLLPSPQEKDFRDGRYSALLAYYTARKLIADSNIEIMEEKIRRSLRYDTSRLSFKTVLTQMVFIVILTKN